MIIYSVMPMQLIFENMEETKYNLRETEYEGVRMLVEPVPYGAEAKIVRLLSPDPQDYLKYTPGQTIHFRPSST